MSGVLSKMTTNQKLAAAAFALGAVALFAKPEAGHAVSISPKELAVIVEKQVDHVTPRDLADWIIAGRADYRLIDLRDEKQYGAYHIPGAELIPLTSLPDQAFSPTEKVVLYSEGGIHSAQAWFLLRARGATNVYFLLGGLDAWNSDVLFPTLAANPTADQQQQNEQLRSVAAHFGGQATVATGGAPSQTSPQAAPPPAMPKVEAPAPAAPGAGAVAGTPKKRREGC